MSFSDLMILLYVFVPEWVTAFRAELRRIVRILGLPAAFIALIKGCSLRLSAAAFGAELTLINCTAGAGPAFLCRLG